MPTCRPLPLVLLAPLVLVLGLPCFARAQTRPVAFPSGWGSGTRCNVGPLGEDPAGQFVECRTQILIPAQFLPPRPETIRALEHAPNWVSTGPSNLWTVQYTMLEITLGHRTRGAGPLSLTFANNLPAPPPPPALPAQPLTITWNVGSWHGVPFTNPFSYNGIDDLVVEIRKVVTPTGQNVCTTRQLNPPPANLHPSIMAVGGQGSGAADATQATQTLNVLGWRLRFDGVPAPTLDVRCTTPLCRNPVTNDHFSVSATSNGFVADYRVFAPNRDLFALMLDVGPLAAAPYAVPPLTGSTWLRPSMQMLTFGIVVLPPGVAFHFHALAVPNAPGLAGLHVAAQAVTSDPQLLAPVWSNAVAFTIQP